MDSDSFFKTLSTILQTKLFAIAGTPIDTITVITFLLIILVSFIVSRIARKGLRHFFKRRGISDEGAISVTQRLIHYTILALGFGIAIHTIGINLAALFAAGALFAVGLGFAMQNIAQNFVSGIILMVERTIKPDDVLWVENQMVRVVSLGMRAIVARTLDEEDLIIPNAVLVQSTVKNYTLRDQLYRIRVPVGVIYGSDMKLVRDTLEHCAMEFQHRNTVRKPVVLMTGFGSSSVDFEVSVWIDNAWNTRQARSRLHEAVWWALKDAGVVIAFPQVDVHLDPPVVDSLQALGRGGANR